MNQNKAAAELQDIRNEAARGVGAGVDCDSLRARCDAVNEQVELWWGKQG